MENVKPAKGKIIAALDIGSFKTTCFIAVVNAEGKPKIIGAGMGETKGIRNGQISSIEDAATSIAHVVSSAEDASAEYGVGKISKVVLSLSGLKTNSYTIVSEVAINKGRPISYHDIYRALKNINYENYLKDSEPIHNFPIDYRVDDSISTPSPKNLYGSKLAAVFHIITADSNSVKNLSSVIRAAHLEVETKVVAGYASGIATLADEEKDIGCCLIEIGGGNTSISTFLHSHLIDVKTIPVGGILISSDIAKGLSVSFKEAERIKTLYGSAIHLPADDRESIYITLAGEDGENRSFSVPKSELVGIIQMRVAELFELVYKYLNSKGLLGVISKIVLTGGSSELTGIREAAYAVFGKNVRVASPVMIDGAPETTQKPAFATAVGLLLYETREKYEDNATRKKEGDGKKGFFGRIWSWISNKL